MAVRLVLLNVIILWASHTECLLLKPLARCLPTDTVHGPCHTCVCKDGVYHCRERVCRELKHAFNEDSKRHCEPNHTYRHNRLICTCSKDGYWKSINCNQKFHRIAPKAYHPSQKLRTNIPCTPHSLYLIDCNICECGKSGYIELSSCTSRRCKRGRKTDICSTGDILRTADEMCSCSDINLYIDRLCFKVSKEAIQEVKRSDVDSIIDIGKSLLRDENLSDEACRLNTTYRIDCNKCVCDRTGRLVCTERNCVSGSEIALRTKGSNDFYSLPKLKGRDSPCTPNNQYRFRCNTCVCSLKGIPSCTTMVCLDEVVIDRKVLEASILKHHEALDD